MPRRLTFDPADPASVARRLDEVVSASIGEDPLGEVVKLLVAKAHLERPAGDGAPPTLALDTRVGPPRTPGSPAGPPMPALAAVPGPPAFPRTARGLDTVLAAATWRWDGVLGPGVLSAGARGPGVLGPGGPADAVTRLTDATVARAADVLDAFRLGRDLGVLDAVFQAVVGRTARGERGQFFTPRLIVRDLVARVGVRPGDRVLDPACGSGGFLLGALQAEPGCEVWGIENDPRAARIARALLAISGVCPTHLLQLDALGDLPPFEGVDVVVTNPPFAGDVGEAVASRFALGQGRRVERDVLFLERCLDLLRPGGRFAIVLPDNKVSAVRMAFVREWLLRHAHVDRVLALPRDAFMPYTSQKACALLGRKRAGVLPRPEPSELVRLEVGGATVDRAIGDLASGWVLAPERYGLGAPAARSEEVVGAARGTGNADATPTVRDLVEVRTVVQRPTAFAREVPVLVLDVGHAWEGLVLATHGPVGGVGSPKAVALPGDVVISRLRSYLRQVAYIDASLAERAPGGNAIAVSAEFVVLRARPGGAMRPAGLLPWLLSEPVQAALAASQEGGHHPRFRADRLAAMRVPANVVGQAAAVADRVEQAAARLREAMALVAGSAGPRPR